MTSQATSIPTCNPEHRTCVVCWYGPECGPFYGIERTSIDTERRCPCDCHARGNEPAFMWTPFPAQQRDWAKYGPVRA